MWSLEGLVVEKHQGCCIDIAHRLEFRPVDTESMEEADRIGVPRDVVVEEDGR